MAEKVNFLDILKSPQWTTADGKGNILAPFELIGNSFGAGKRELQRKKDLQQRTEATVPQMAEGAVTQQNAETGRIGANTEQLKANTTFINTQNTGADLGNQNLREVLNKTKLDAEYGKHLANELERWYGPGVSTQAQADVREAGQNRAAFQERFGDTPKMFDMTNAGNTAVRAQTSEEEIAAQNTALFTQGEALSPAAQEFRRNEIQNRQFGEGLKSQEGIHAANNKTSIITGILNAYPGEYDEGRKSQMFAELQRQGYMAPNSYSPAPVDPYADVDSKVRGTGSETKGGASAPAKTRVDDGRFLPTTPSTNSVPQNNPGLWHTQAPATANKPVQGPAKKTNAEDIMKMLEKFKVQTPDATPMVDLKSLEAMLDASKDAPETLRNRVNVGRGELEADLAKVREMIRQLQGTKGAK